jgi:tRNA nucleotidyltransferase (CCA-adding enzyme)
MAMMKAMVDNGEVDALVPDRVWKETQEALAGRDPHTFFAVLRDCGALRSVYPEIDALFGVPQPAKWHPEIDCGVHTLMVLQQATLLSRDADVRFAALVHDLGKATTPKEHLPSHNGHERRSVKLVRNLCQRLPVPKSFRELGLLAAEFHGHCHRAFELRPETVLKVLERTDAFRREDRFEKFLLACEADARGRTGFEGRDYPQANYLRGALAATRGIAAADIAASGADGAEIGAQLRQERARAIGSFKASYAQPPK